MLAFFPTIATMSLNGRIGCEVILSLAESGLIETCTRSSGLCSLGPQSCWRCTESHIAHKAYPSFQHDHLAAPMHWRNVFIPISILVSVMLSSCGYAMPFYFSRFKDEYFRHGDLSSGHCFFLLLFFFFFSFSSTYRFVFQTKALKENRAIAVVTAAATSTILTGVIIGIFFLGESLPSSSSKTALRLFSWALLIFGVACLTNPTSMMQNSTGMKEEQK